MMLENVFLAVVISSFATYICRFYGVLFSTKLNIDSWLFDWISCISFGIIIAVISKIIIFPEGLLKETSYFSRIFSTISLLLIFFSLKKVFYCVLYQAH